MKNCAKMTPARKVTEEHIFSHDLKMWAKSAGRKFKKAYDRFIDLKKQDINSNAYWDEDNNIVIRSEDNTINEKFKDG
tara:strand:+ start:210 stop:443 length:234 start_codon:yes stop_codon:yes gene_type:complete